VIPINVGQDLDLANRGQETELFLQLSGGDEVAGLLKADVIKLDFSGTEAIAAWKHSAAHDRHLSIR
jgi:hypothetical protein